MRYLAPLQGGRCPAAPCLKDLSNSTMHIGQRPQHRLQHVPYLVLLQGAVVQLRATRKPVIGIA